MPSATKIVTKLGRGGFWIMIPRPAYFWSTCLHTKFHYNSRDVLAQHKVLRTIEQRKGQQKKSHQKRWRLFRSKEREECPFFVATASGVTFLY
jgi:hypothetical protein